VGEVTTEGYYYNQEYMEERLIPKVWDCPHKEAVPLYDMEPFGTIKEAFSRMPWLHSYGFCYQPPSNNDHHFCMHLRFERFITDWGEVEEAALTVVLSHGSYEVVGDDITNYVLVEWLADPSNWTNSKEDADGKQAQPQTSTA